MSTPAVTAIREGSRHDYAALARYHYRPERPATIARILVFEAHGEPRAGVLVVSSPALNGPWRERAWPGRYTARTPAARREALARLNREVRVISRVIVDPRFRAIGIGRALVHAYLSDPLTIHTEALAAMGRFCPFFAAAGMREVACPPARRVRTLRSVLAELGIEPCALADPDTLLQSLPAHPLRTLERALRTFADAHRDTRALKQADLRTLLIAAARRVSTDRCAYVACATGSLLPVSS